MKKPDHNGITVIELLVVLSTITLLLAVGVPRIGDFAIRARVSEALVVAAAARDAMKMTCASDPSAQIHEFKDAGFQFEPTHYVENVLMVADCSNQKLWLGVVTRNTGAFSDPYLTYETLPGKAGSSGYWQCRLVRGDEAHVPGECPATIF